MCKEFKNLTAENIKDEHLCCIIRSTKVHEGVEAKRKWLKDRLSEGHVFRKLDEKATVFIEYAPIEKAWVPIKGENYLYIYCLWVLGDYRGKGYGKKLMEYCIEDAKKSGKSGVCMLAAKKQKAWLSNQDFAKKFGFETVDETDSGYELLTLAFDDKQKPQFSDSAKRGIIENKELTIYYDNQCPYVWQTVQKTKAFCDEMSVPATFIEVDTMEKAKELPCVFNNWAVFYAGEFKTVNLLDVNGLKRLMGMR